MVIVTISHNPNRSEQFPHFEGSALSCRKKILLIGLSSSAQSEHLISPFDLFWAGIVTVIRKSVTVNKKNTGTPECDHGHTHNLDNIWSVRWFRHIGKRKGRQPKGESCHPNSPPPKRGKFKPPSWTAPLYYTVTLFSLYYITSRL